jgi:hypothetical protein
VLRTGRTRGGFERKPQKSKLPSDKTTTNKAGFSWPLPPRLQCQEQLGIGHHSHAKCLRRVGGETRAQLEGALCLLQESCSYHPSPWTQSVLNELQHSLIGVCDQVVRLKKEGNCLNMEGS